jgi:hypothetical protein
LVHGCTREAFRRYYYRPLRKLALDNRLGMHLFRLDRWISKSRLDILVLGGLLRELRSSEYGGLVTAAFRALFSGELSYKLISGLLLSGMLMHVLQAGFIRPGRGKDCSQSCD